MTLEAAERRSLEAVCRALLPRLGEAKDDAIFRLGADDLRVADAVAQAIALLGERQSRELRLFLRLLDSPAFMVIAARRYVAFASLPPDARERALLAMASHPLPVIRTGFQALKRLATFLFYSVHDERGTNPVLASLGYRVPEPHPARSALKITRVDGATTLTADVCVIGSGAGGSVVASQLAAAGREVLVLEAGPADQASDFDHREIVGMQRLYLDQGTTATRDLGIAILAGSSVGGGTTVNWQTSLRTPDFIRDEWAEASGVRAFADETFTRSLDAVCERLGVGTGESRHNANNSALARGCAALGYRSSVIPRNARGCDLAQCGFCVFGCRVGGKQSTTVTYLADAQRGGKTTIVASCRANALVVTSGRVTGVHASVTNSDGTRVDLRVKAPLVVVAAGALETPALLMRTGIEHQQLGRNLFLHPTSAVGAEYDEPIRGWMGAPQSVLCDEFAQLDGRYGFRLETPPIHPGLFAMAIPWEGAREHRELLRHIERCGAFIVLTRDRNGGTVRVDREGRAVSRYALDQRQRAIVRRGIAEAARVHWAAGARRIHTVHTRTLHLDRDDPRADIDAYCAAIERAPVHGNRSQLFSAHQMGTCRMGTDERASVCDENGAVRGVRGLYVADTSLFPASSGVNPMITVMAVAHMLGARLTS